MKNNHIILLLVALLMQSCATGVRPLVGVRHETYSEKYSAAGNRRYGTAVTSPDNEKKSYSGSGVEFGYINIEGRGVYTGTVFYNRFPSSQATAAGPGNPSLKTDVDSAGFNLAAGYNLLTAPFMLRPELILKYQTYYFSDEKIPAALAPLAFDRYVSHSSIGIGAAVQIPLYAFTLLFRGYYSVPDRLDNDELDSASSTDLSISFVFGEPGKGRSTEKK